MPTLHVCSLSKLHDTVRESRASHVLTVINARTPVERPAIIPPSQHLTVSVSDIVAEQDGHITPQERHIDEIIGFVRRWDRARPMVIHCYAGVSRSTASAFIAACVLNPARSEAEFAQTIRRLSPTATPNMLFVQIADGMLGRGGRMVDAIAAIGRGEDCFEGVPFSLRLK